MTPEQLVRFRAGKRVEADQAYAQDIRHALLNAGPDVHKIHLVGARIDGELDRLPRPCEETPLLGGLLHPIDFLRLREGARREKECGARNRCPLKELPP